MSKKAEFCCFLYHLELLQCGWLLLAHFRCNTHELLFRGVVFCPDDLLNLPVDLHYNLLANWLLLNFLHLQKLVKLMFLYTILVFEICAMIYMVDILLLQKKVSSYCR